MIKLVKIGFVLVLFFLTALPLVQHKHTIIEEPALNGSFKLANAPSWSWSSWSSSDFQDQYERYIRDHIGFRNSLVRLHNQIQFSLFRKTTAKDVEIGRKGYLYEGGYIRDYLGSNFIGKAIVEQRVRALLEIQKELMQDSTHLMIVFAPGKASFFPEYLPSKYDAVEKSLSNYDYYVQQCIQMGLPHIDFNSYFSQLKESSDYELIPKGGIHWGQYGVAVAFDTIAQFVEQKFALDMVSFNYSDVYYPDTVRAKDMDISDGMNLLFDYSVKPMPEPIYQFDDTAGTKKPRLLIIGDSFGSRILESPLSDALFSDTELWYYCKGIVPSRSKEVYSVSQLNVKNELRQFNLVMLVVAPTNMHKFDFGFSDTYYAAHIPTGSYEYYLKRIKGDEEWMKWIVQQANELNISVDSSLTKDAREWAEKQSN